MRARAVVYMVCTGNAARSPMAAAMLRACDTDSRLDIRSAGTLVLEGHPMSSRTRSALARHGLIDHSHRSRQFRASDAEAADLVVVMEPLHLHWMRRNLPAAASMTGSLCRLVRDLPPPESGPDAVGLAARVAILGLGSLEPEPWEEVVDPAAGDQAVFDRCSNEILTLVRGLYPRLI